VIAIDVKHHCLQFLVIILQSACPRFHYGGPNN